MSCTGVKTKHVKIMRFFLLLLLLQFFFSLPPLPLAISRSRERLYKVGWWTNQIIAPNYDILSDLSLLFLALTLFTSSEDYLCVIKSRYTYQLEGSLSPVHLVLIVARSFTWNSRKMEYFKRFLLGKEKSVKSQHVTFGMCSLQEPIYICEIVSQKITKRQIPTYMGNGDRYIPNRAGHSENILGQKRFNEECLCFTHLYKVATM